MTDPIVILGRRAELIDPHAITDDLDLLSLRRAVFEPLVELDDAGNPRPVLARDWACEENGRRWTLHLRPDVRFHDGRPLTARDVVATLTRVTEGEIGGELAARGVYAQYLSGARFVAADRETVRITPAEPLADLLDLLAMLMIVPEAFAQGDDAALNGTGPYRVIEHAPGQITLEAVDDARRAKPGFPRLTWIAEPDSSSRVAAMRDSTADLTHVQVLPERFRLDASDGVTVVDAYTSLCVAFLLNCQSGPCRDPRVRQALNLGVDVDAFVATLLGGAAMRLNGPFTPRHLGYDPQLAPYPHDPERARDLLRAAGFGAGMELIVDIPTSHPDEAPELARMLAAQLERVGIRLDVRTHQDRQAYAELVRDKQIGDACCFDSSPQSTFRVLREKLDSRVQGPWWQGYHNADVNALIDRAARTADLDQRRQVFQAAARRLHQDAPWLFLYSPTVRFVRGPRLRHWRPGSNGLMQFSER